MNVTLYDDLILVRLLPMEKVSEGGIIIPDTADKTNKKATGIVIEHGEGYMDLSTGIRQEITVQKNDKVSFTFGLGTPMDELGEDLLLLRERDLDFIIMYSEDDNYPRLDWLYGYIRSKEEHLRLRKEEPKYNHFNIRDVITGEELQKLME